MFCFSFSYVQNLCYLHNKYQPFKKYQILIII